MTGTRASGTYLAPNNWDQARRRLDLLEACFDPATIRRLQATGVGPGWHCLEVGGGGGSVTRWLCDRVGERGRVTALDIDTRFLDGLDCPNLTVVQQNVVGQPPPVAAYDLVHTRAVLMHLPAREAVLADLAAALRPGGWLVIEEMDFFPIRGCDTAEYGDLVEALAASIAPAGSVVDWARHLPARMATLGLDDIVAEADVGFFPGGSMQAEFWTLSLQQVRDVVVAGGCSEAALDRGLAVLEDPQRWFPNMATIGTRGCRR